MSWRIRIEIFRKMLRTLIPQNWSFLRKWEIHQVFLILGFNGFKWRKYAFRRMRYSCKYKMPMTWGYERPKNFFERRLPSNIPLLNLFQTFCIIFQVGDLKNFAFYLLFLRRLQNPQQIFLTVQLASILLLRFLSFVWTRPVTFLTRRQI